MSNKIYTYKNSYAHQPLRGVDVNQRPWTVYEIVNKYCNGHEALLDIGCGTAYKTIPLCDEFEALIGLEPSSAMLDVAHENIKEAKAKNYYLVKAVSEKLPFQNNQFNVVTAFLTWANYSEIARVLKPDGMFIRESLGAEDKKEFTRYFGKDDHGWRGANLNYSQSELIAKHKAELNPYFSKVEIINGEWQTKYNKNGLWKLLTNTYSTVKNFNEKKDKVNFERAIAELENNNEIILKQNRLLIIAYL